MQVKVINEFLGIPKGTIGTITTQQGEPKEAMQPNDRSMWIKFDSKDMPVGIPEPFEMFIVRLD